MQSLFKIIVIASALSLIGSVGMAQSPAGIGSQPGEVRMADIPPSATAKVTVERRGQIVLIGINRPYIQNRLDPEAYGACESLPRLRSRSVASRGRVVWTRRDFSRGIDVDGFKALPVRRSL